MSIAQMVKVWQHEFPHPEQAVMMALADHAHDDGTGIRPSIDRIAWKTGYARRNVQLILGRLKASGMVVEVKAATSREPAEYAFDWTKAQPKLPFDEYLEQKRAKRGRKNYTPDAGVISGSSLGCIEDHPRGDQRIVFGAIHRSPEPTENHQDNHQRTYDRVPSPEKVVAFGDPSPTRGHDRARDESQFLAPEKPAATESVSAEVSHSHSGKQQSGSGQGKNSAARAAQRKQQKAERIYGQIRDRDAFESFWVWYRTAICEIPKPHRGRAASPGKKVEAAAAWAELEACDFLGRGREAFRTGCKLQWAHYDRTGGTDIPHACRFLYPASGEPEWLNRLDDQQPAQQPPFVDKPDDSQAIAASPAELHREIGRELRRLNKTSELDEEWRERTGAYLVTDLGAKQARDYLDHLRTINAAHAVA